VNSDPEEPKNIFIADDDEDDRMFLSDALRQSCNAPQLTEIDDGVDLMKKLNKAPFLYAVFLDLNMPCKNGFECLKEIRESPKLNYIPIVVISTSSNRDLIDRAYLLGANYYMCKPNSTEDLQILMDKLISFNLAPFGGQPKREAFVLKA